MSRNPRTALDGIWGVDGSFIERGWDWGTDLPGQALEGVRDAAGELLSSSRETAGELLSSGGEAARELGGNMVDEGLQMAREGLTSEFMKNYGYVGAAVLVYMTLFKGTGFKTAAIVAGIASTLFGQFVKPYVSQYFNRSSGVGDPRYDRTVTPDNLQRSGDLVGQGPRAASHGVPTNLQLAAQGPAHELE